MQKEWGELFNLGATGQKNQYQWPRVTPKKHIINCDIKRGLRVVSFSQCGCQPQMRSKFKLILAALSCFFYWIWRSSMSSTRRVISANIRSKSLEGYVSIKNTSLKLHWHESIHNTWSNKHCAAKQEQCCFTVPVDAEPGTRSLASVLAC